MNCDPCRTHSAQLIGSLVTVMTFHTIVDRTGHQVEILLSLKKDSRNRGHEVALTKDQCRLNIRKYQFSERKIN